MPMIRTWILITALAFSAGPAGAQQGAPKGTSPATPSQSTSGSPVPTGACVTTHADGSTSCTAPIDAAGCRMQGLEARLQPVWTAGQRCP